MGVTRKKTITSTCEESVEVEFEHYSQICCPRVGSNENENLSAPKKDTIIWNWKLGTSV